MEPYIENGIHVKPARTYRLPRLRKLTHEIYGRENDIDWSKSYVGDKGGEIAWFCLISKTREIPKELHNYYYRERQGAELIDIWASGIQGAERSLAWYLWNMYSREILPDHIIWHKYWYLDDNTDKLFQKLRVNPFNGAESDILYLIDLRLARYYWKTFGPGGKRDKGLL